MKYFEVIGFRRDCCGNTTMTEIIKRYSIRDDAEKFKQFWEALWKAHTDAKDTTSPCWYDYEPELKISEQKVEERFDINKVMYEYCRN